MTPLEKIWKSRWPNFAPEEMLSPSGLVLFQKGILVMDLDFLDRLQAFRDWVDEPIIITSGFRACSENAKYGDTPFHPMGKAADIVVKDVPPLELAHMAKEFGFSGIGVYDKHVHIDTRPNLTDKSWWWDNRTKETDGDTEKDS